VYPLAFLAVLSHWLVHVDVSYAAPKVHRIVIVALHWEYPPGIVFIFFPREEGSPSCLRLTQRVTLTSTTKLYKG
jgi:hypothetical protein